MPRDCAGTNLRGRESFSRDENDSRPLIRPRANHPALFDIPCEQATTALGPGDLLLLYIDGVTESHGPGGMFGKDRLVRAILSGRRGAALLDALLSEVIAFSNSPNNQDDITLLAVDLAEPAAALDVVLGV